MKKTRIVLLAAAMVVSSCPATVLAQPDDEEEAADDDEEGDDEEADDDEADDDEGDDEEADDDEGDDEEADDDEGDDEEADDDEAADEGATEDPEAGGLKAICEIDPDACPVLDFDKEAARPIREPLYAVQQIFVLRVGRFELNPYWGFTLNDQFVAHPGPGLALNYWITNVLAVGINGNYYDPFNEDSDFNFQTRRAARIGVPLTEYQWGAALNFTYAPLIGKFAGFGDFIFQYDAYVVGGVGALSTRPIPVLDPTNRLFNYEPKLAFNAGLGLHIFFNRWFAVTGEIRDYIFFDQLENTTVAVGREEEESTWLGDQRLTNGVAAQLGVSIFLPFSFEYRLPK